MIVRVVVHVGVQVGLENAAVLDPGRPVTENATGWVPPETRVAVIVDETLPP